MNKDKETAIANANANESESEDVANVALTPVTSTQLMEAGGFEGIANDLVASIASDINETLKQLSVTEFKGGRALLDKGPLTLLDAFPFTMTEQDKQNAGQTVDVRKVILTVADQHGEITNVMQNASASRERFITLYAQVRAANAKAGTKKQLSLTNVHFAEVGQAKFGNKAVVLQFTPETRSIWSNG